MKPKNEVCTGFSPSLHKKNLIALASSMEDDELKNKIAELKKVVKEKTAELEKMAEEIVNTKNLAGTNRAHVYMRRVDALESVKIELRIFKDELAKRKEVQEENIF